MRFAYARTLLVSCVSMLILAPAVVSAADISSYLAQATTPPATQPAANSTLAPCTSSTTAPTVPDVALTLSVPIGNQSSVTGLPQYILLWFRYAIGIAGLAATVMAVYGGFRYLMGATSGDIGRGKEIIRDAVAGMLLVLGSYVILYNINPATTRLSMPDISSIAPCNPNLGEFKTMGFADPGQKCQADEDCKGGGSCILSDASDSLMESLGKSVAERAGVTNGPEVGRCSTGQKDEACRCSGKGCMLTSEVVAALRDSSPTTVLLQDTPGLNIAYGLRQTMGTAINNIERLQNLTPKTNNGGTGVVNCATGLTCGYDPSSQAGRINWKCMQEQARGEAVFQQEVQNKPNATVECVKTAGVSETVAHVLGMESIDGRPPGGCNADEVCIRWDPDSKNPRGYCSSRSAATAGQLCKCAGWGCNPTPVGWSLTTGCAAGLQCDLVRSSGSSGLQNYYYCVPPAGSTPTPTTPVSRDVLCSGYCDLCTDSGSRTTCNSVCRAFPALTPQQHAQQDFDRNSFLGWSASCPR